MRGHAYPGSHGAHAVNKVGKTVDQQLELSNVRVAPPNVQIPGQPAHKQLLANLEAGAIQTSDNLDLAIFPCHQRRCLDGTCLQVGQ